MEEKIMNLLAEICEDDVVKQEMDVNLFETGLLDSLTFAELLVEIEDNFNIVIAPSEIDRKDMNTPRKIIRLINMRL